jgi:hypothetical protein
LVSRLYRCNRGHSWTGQELEIVHGYPRQLGATHVCPFKRDDKTNFCGLELLIVPGGETVCEAVNYVFRPASELEAEYLRAKHYPELDAAYRRSVALHLFWDVKVGVYTPSELKDLAGAEFKKLKEEILRSLAKAAHEDFDYLEDVFARRTGPGHPALQKIRPDDALTVLEMLLDWPIGNVPKDLPKNAKPGESFYERARQWRKMPAPGPTDSGLGVIVGV